jgi:hypothetical protein
MFIAPDKNLLLTELIPSRDITVDEIKLKIQER